MDPGSFLQGFSRETTIRRDAEGRWFHDGEPLVHPKLTESFQFQLQSDPYMSEDDIALLLAVGMTHGAMALATSCTTTADARAPITAAAAVRLNPRALRHRSRACSHSRLVRQAAAADLRAVVPAQPQPYMRAVAMPTTTAEQRQTACHAA